MNNLIGFVSKDRKAAANKKYSAFGR